MSKSLCVTVWKWTTNGENTLCGGVVIPLNSRDIATVEPKLYQLKKKVVRKI